MATSPLARLAALLADDSRAAICLALLDNRAWTAGELARHAGIAPSTASAHITLLVEGGVLAQERQGRHRYVRLANPEIATLLEDMSSVTPPLPPRGGLREAARATALARARTCYDHLAGRLGVALTEALTTHDFALTERAADWVSSLDATEHSSRPFLRSCLDWTERRPHLAGVAGAAICAHALRERWVERIGSGRALRVTPTGLEQFAALGANLR